MKNFLLILCFVAGGAGAQTSPDSLFYYHLDERVPLVVDDTKALLPRNIRTRAFDGGIIEMPTAKEIVLPYLERRFGMILVQSKRGVATQSFQESVSNLQPTDGVINAKVYRAGNALIVLTDTFTIELEKVLPKNEVLSLLAAPRLKFKFELRQADLVQNSRLLLRRPKRWRLTIKDDTSPEEALRQVNELYGVTPIVFAAPDLITIDLDPLLDEKDTKELRQYIESIPILADVRLVPCLPGTGPIPNDAYFPRQWHLMQEDQNGNRLDIRAPEGWVISKASSDIKIAVLDLGVDRSHPDLDGVLAQADHLDATEENHPAPMTANDAHGTRVAGLAAAETNKFCRGVAGVGWGATLVSIRIAENAEGHGKVYGPKTIVDAVDLAVLAKAKIIVMAFHQQLPGYPELTQTIKDAINCSGIVFVVAAGNYKGAATDTQVKYPGTLSGSSDTVLAGGVITVGATTTTGHIKTPGGPGGGLPFLGSRTGSAVSLAAPGVMMVTTDNTGLHPGSSDPPYAYSFGGTSAATPVVAGAAAILRTCYPQATPAQVKRWLQQGADEGPDQTSVPDDYYGHGRLNLEGALKAAKQDMLLSVPPSVLVPSFCKP